MIYPTTDEQLAAIIDTLDAHVAPHVTDEYAASACRTISQLLRSVRARIAQEPTALHEDTQDLGHVLASLAPHVPSGLAAEIASIPTSEPDPPQLEEMQATALAQRNLLERSIAAIPDRDHPARREARAYLGRHLDRQRPWTVDAYDGPRR